MVGESNQNILLIQIDASSFAEFEISEFEIVRVDCILSECPKKVGASSGFKSFAKVNNEIKNSLLAS